MKQQAYETGKETLTTDESDSTDIWCSYSDGEDAGGSCGGEGDVFSEGWWQPICEYRNRGKAHTYTLAHQPFR